MRIAALSLLPCLLIAQPAPFPKPNPQHVFAELKTPGPWPPERISEDWSAARARIAESPLWQAWLDRERAALDDWMEKRRDRTEWTAGWWHDFVSPKDGSFLTWTPDEPKDFFSSPSDARVAVTPKLHGAWVFGFRNRHAQKIVDAARLFRLTGESRYAEWAASQLDFYAANFEKWPLKTNSEGKPCCRLSWQSLDEAVNLVRYVTAARHLGDYPSVERRTAWIGQLFRPEAMILNATFQRIHNIACWHRSAMAHVALYANDDELWRLAVDAPFGIRDQVARGITSDYLWLEQSLGYNQYVVSALEPFFRYALLAGRAGSLRDEIAATGNLLLAPITLRFPSGQLPNPADSTGGLRRAPSPSSLGAFFVVFPTPIGLDHAAHQRDWDALLFAPAAPTAPPALPSPAARHLESSRMAILRDGPWQVYVHYGQIDASHAQAEALNFEAAFDTLDITHDPGTVGYGSPLHKGFYTRGIAHNVPLVDGEGQQRWNPGTAVGYSPRHIQARQENYRPGYDAERTIRIDGPRLLDTVTLTPREPGAPAHRLGLALHFQGIVDLPVAFRPAPIPLPYWENAHGASFDSEARLTVRIGERPFLVKLRATTPFKLFHGLTPDVPPDRRHSLYLETEAPSARFETILEPVSGPR